MPRKAIIECVNGRDNVIRLFLLTDKLKGSTRRFWEGRGHGAEPSAVKANGADCAVCAGRVGKRRRQGPPLRAVCETPLRANPESLAPNSG